MRADIYSEGCDACQGMRCREDLRVKGSERRLGVIFKPAVCVKAAKSPRTGMSWTRTCGGCLRFPSAVNERRLILARDRDHRGLLSRARKTASTRWKNSRRRSLFRSRQVGMKEKEELRATRNSLTSIVLAEQKCKFDVSTCIKDQARELSWRNFDLALTGMRVCAKSHNPI